MNSGLSVKRVVVSTLFGLVAGAVCATGGLSIGIVKLTPVDLMWVFLNRGVVMGFAIGISALRVHWAWNEVIMGLVVGSIFSYSLFMMHPASGILPIGNALANGASGLIIEFFTTVVFKSPGKASAPLRASDESMKTEAVASSVSVT